jgi:hypothetical protein
VIARVRSPLSCSNSRISRRALGDVSRKANRARAWRDILCIQEERVVGDDTSSGSGLSLQIPRGPRPLVVRGKVRMHE